MTDWRYYDPELGSTPIPRLEVMPVGTVRRAARKAALIFGLAGAAVGFWAGRAASDQPDWMYALHLRITSSDGGAWVTVYGGTLATQDLCAMAGRGIVAEVSAEAPGAVIQFTCTPVPAGRRV